MIDHRPFVVTSFSYGLKCEDLLRFKQFLVVDLSIGFTVFVSTFAGSLRHGLFFSKFLVEIYDYLVSNYLIPLSRSKYSKKCLEGLF